MNKGLARSLIAPPRILGPFARALGPLRWHAPDVVVQQAHHVAEAEQTEFPDNPVDRKRGADLHSARPGTGPVLEHLLQVSVLLEPVPARVATVGLGDSLQAHSGISRRFVPGHPDERIISPIVEAIFAAQFGMVRERRKPIVSPLFPAFAYYWTFESVRPIHATETYIPSSTL